MKWGFITTRCITVSCSPETLAMAQRQPLPSVWDFGGQQVAGHAIGKRSHAPNLGLPWHSGHSSMEAVWYTNSCEKHSMWFQRKPFLFVFISCPGAPCINAVCYFVNGCRDSSRGILKVMVMDTCSIKEVFPSLWVCGWSVFTTKEYGK